MKTQYDCISVSRDFLQTLALSAPYKRIAACALAQRDAGKDNLAVWREIRDQILDTPMQGGDYDDAAYAVEAYMLGLDHYYRDCLAATSGEMLELADLVVTAVVDGEMTPRRAAEKWVATHILRQYGYPTNEEQYAIALDVAYGRIQGNGIHRAMERRCQA